MDARMVDHMPASQPSAAYRKRLQRSRVLSFLRSQYPTIEQTGSLALLAAITLFEVYVLGGL